MVKLDDFRIGNTRDLKYDVEIAEGEHVVKLETVYPWKTITKETDVIVRDDNGYPERDENNNVIKEKKTLTYDVCNYVVSVDGGIAAKGFLSTHPDRIKDLKNFMYAFKMFNVSASDISKKAGAVSTAMIKNRVNTYTDKNTGLEVSRTENYVSYFPTKKVLERDETDMIDGSDMMIPV